MDSPEKESTIAHYNMVGVVVAMAISTMHDRFAQCMENWKKFQNSVIHTSRNHNDEIVEVSQSLISYHNYTTQLFRKLFLTKLSKNSYLNYHWF